MGVPPENYVSFFSGCGFLDDAVGRVFDSARPLCFVENELTAVARLAARMEEGALPPAPVWSDARGFPSSLFRGRADMAIGGFPCTDISLAGRGAGIHGEESGLFFVLADAVRDLGVDYVFLENVAALTLRGLDAVLGTLAGLGFDAEWGCLRASDVGAPHRRDRWWCLAWQPDLLANDRRSRGSQVTVFNDQRGALGGSKPGPDGRTGDGGAPARVSRRIGTDAPGQDDLRIGSAPLANGTGRGCRIGQPVALATPGGAPARALESGCEGSSGSPLVHAGGRQLQRLGEPGVLAGAGRATQGEAPERERGWYAAGDPGQGSDGQLLEDAECIGGASGLPAAARGHGVAAEPAVADHASRGLAALPEWPPLPDDTAGWRAVLSQWPELAPALPESALRRVADAGSEWDRHDVPWAPCDCNRADRLRGLGNGVCTAQAETALRLLWYRAFGEWP